MRVQLGRASHITETRYATFLVASRAACRLKADLKNRTSRWSCFADRAPRCVLHNNNNGVTTRVAVTPTSGKPESAPDC